MPLTAPRGTQDILPADARRWQWLEELFRRACARYGYGEIRTPIFEDTELFTRSVGEETDIVSKQMYSFTSRGGDSLTLRPEGTAPAVRAVVQHNLLAQGGMLKLHYSGPIFRYERPQKGRYRQFHQLGVEAFGSAGPQIDVEVLAFAADFLRTLGIDAVLEMNSVGCPACRPRYRDALRNALSGARTTLCPDCTRRYDANPLRILDCKVEQCREMSRDVPVILDVLCDDCTTHLQGVETGLRAVGVGYIVNPHIVRGLDYYTRTAFEFIAGAGLGAQNTVLAGGRYDGLVAELGGTPTPAIGFAAGIERLLLSAGDAMPLPESPGPVFLATLGEVARAQGVILAETLRRSGIPAAIDYAARSLKAQMKEANRQGAWYALILGENELACGEATLRDMRTASETAVPLDRLIEHLRPYYP